MYNTSLKLQDAVQLSGAIQRLEELSQLKILTAENEAEQKGLVAFVEKNGSQHLQPLLATYIAVVTEYEPFIKGVAGVLRRAGFFNQQMAADTAVEAPKETEAK